jgi:hypothetical protein
MDWSWQHRIGSPDVSNSPQMLATAGTWQRASNAVPINFDTALLC